MDLQTIGTFACALFAIVLALGELIAPARGTALARARLRGLILATLAPVIVHGHLLVSESMTLVPWFFGWQSPSGLLIPPAIYRYVQLSLSDAGDSPAGVRRFWMWSALPAIIALAHALYQAIGFPEHRLERIADFYAGHGPEYWIILLGFAYVLAFVGAAVVSILRRSGIQAPGRGAALLLPVALCGAAVATFGAIALLAGALDLLSWSVYGMAAFVPTVYLLARRNPDFVSDWVERLDRRAARSARGESRLAGQDVEALLARLDRLMNEDRLFANEELSVADLGRALGINSHQVSELLNQQVGASFFHYVNGLRVTEACRRLRTEVDRTILSIAYEVGFNSKSAFHRAFTRHTGLSPREYRRNPQNAID
ncbi:MAG: AraC family transcriptional regulator [bacterium]|nr:AraC family transcriptional regulator [bacterium]